MQPKYVIVAHIARPLGLKGEVEVVSLTDFPERFKEGQRFYPSPPLAGLESLVIEKLEFKPKAFIVKFEGIDSREEAQRIADRDLVIPAAEAAKLSEGEFWVSDIIGMEVQTTAGEHLGDVIDVLRTGSNDVYVVQNNKQYLIPATKEVVKEISPQNRRITIEPIPGLLE